MKETFIAFFDILGFKELVNRKPAEELKSVMEHLLRDTQSALANGKYTHSPFGTIVPDLSKFGINCLHVSDSIIFWTNEAKVEDFNKIVDVCHAFYSTCIQLGPLLRGCLTFGEIDFYPFKISSCNEENQFINSSLYGKGLVEAYSKADSLEFVGCTIEQTAIDYIKTMIVEKPEGYDVNFVSNLIYDQKICYYKIPSKNGSYYGHAFTPTIGTYNEVSFRNAAKEIESHFTHRGEIELSPSVKTKLNNTLDFLSHFRLVVDNLREDIEKRMKEQEDGETKEE